MMNGVVSRNNSFREPLIRAIVKVDQAIQTVSLEAGTFEHHLNIFPNPTTDRFTLESSFPKPQPALIRLISMAGQTIWTKDLHSVAEVSEIIEVKELPKGIYFIELRTPGAVSSTFIEVK